MKDEVKLALLEAVWVMRWNEEETAMSARLTVEEASVVCKDVIIELNKIGYEIKKI